MENLLSVGNSTFDLSPFQGGLPSILAVALFFSPIGGDFSRWPTTLTPGMTILAGAAGFFVISRSIKSDIIGMLSAVYSLVMTYASLSAIVYIICGEKL
jgi:hypothetical protein